MDRRQFFSRLGQGAAVGATFNHSLSPLALGQEEVDHVTIVDHSRDKERLDPNQRRSVLVIGGGVGGLSAALELAERGYQVTVREAEAQFGGRLHTRKESLRTGDFHVEHGLHMWFYQYYMFQDILERLDVVEDFEDFNEVYYEFKTYKPELIRSKGHYPANLLTIVAESPNISFLDAAGVLEGAKDIAFFNHDTFIKKYDHLTLKQWAEENRVNKDFYNIIMEPAASVTLNDPHKVSAAEMLLYMHYYFIGHPRAFHRTIPKRHHGVSVIDPWVTRLKSEGASMQTRSPVKHVRFLGDGQIVVDNQTFDAVVFAADVPGLKTLFKSATAESEYQPQLTSLKQQVEVMGVAPSYHILRLWLDRPTSPERERYQAVIETPQHLPVNLICLYHMLEEESRQWAASSRGSVLELHLYNTPEFNGLDGTQIWLQLQHEVIDVLPELNGARVLDSALGRFENFPSFEPGQASQRPEFDYPQTLGMENVYFAGDWLHTRYPTALMERAVATGREAANAILAKDGIRKATITHAKKRGPGFLPRF